MKKLTTTFVAAVLWLGVANPLQATETLESLAGACVDALKKNDKAAFEQLFISPEELVRSITEDAYKDNPKERKRMMSSFEKDGKQRLLRALAEAKGTSWQLFRPQGLNWTNARIVKIEPSYNRQDGVEKTDWSRITLQSDGQTFLLNLHQSRKTPEGWRLVFGGKLKGPLRMPPPESEE